MEKNQSNEIISIYEGWRINNKKELYGRLIHKTGLVYVGEFKNNLPHGHGEMLQIEIEGYVSKIIYPLGLKYVGKFFNGSREDDQGNSNFNNQFIGIFQIPSVEGERTYYGAFKNNKMNDVFIVVK